MNDLSDNKKRKQWTLYGVIRRFLCFLGWHKWEFGSTILEISKRDLNPFSIKYKMGEVSEYDYKCECCGYIRRRVKSWSYFHYSDRWAKKDKI